LEREVGVVETAAQAQVAVAGLQEVDESVHSVEASATPRTVELMWSPATSEAGRAAFMSWQNERRRKMPLQSCLCLLRLHDLVQRRGNPTAGGVDLFVSLFVCACCESSHKCASERERKGEWESERRRRRRRRRRVYWQTTNECRSVGTTRSHVALEEEEEDESLFKANKEEEEETLFRG